MLDRHHPWPVGWFQFLNRTDQASSGSYDDSCETRGSALGPQSLLGSLWGGLCIRFLLAETYHTPHDSRTKTTNFFRPKKRGEDEEATPTDRRAMQRSLLHPRSSYAYFLVRHCHPPPALHHVAAGSELLPPRQGDPPILTDRRARDLCKSQ